MCIKVTLIVAVALIITFPSASAKSQIATIFGAGREVCSEWTEHGRDPDSKARLRGSSWVLGYLSDAALQHFPPSLLALEDSKMAITWMDTYRAAHPEEFLFNASNDLIVELTEKMRHGFPGPPRSGG
jgi:hypothetical protein